MICVMHCSTLTLSRLPTLLIPWQVKGCCSFSSCLANCMQSVVIHVPSCSIHEDLAKQHMGLWMGITCFNVCMWLQTYTQKLAACLVEEPMISHQSNLHRWTAEVTGLVSTQSDLTRFGTIYVYTATSALLPAKQCCMQMTHCPGDWQENGVL